MQKQNLHVFDNFDLSGIGKSTFWKMVYACVSNILKLCEMAGVHYIRVNCSYGSAIKDVVNLIPRYCPFTESTVSTVKAIGWMTTVFRASFICIFAATTNIVRQSKKQRIEGNSLFSSHFLSSD